MLKFNAFGLLTPPENISSDIAELEEVFVTGIETLKRRELFSNYIRYTNELKSRCGDHELTQWIDGSFVMKKPEPGDIDLVTFIDFSIAEKLSDDLKDFKHPLSEIVFGVDAYLVKKYPPDHRLHKLFISDSAYWMEHFSKTRRNRIGNKLSKGFLEIKT
jgi:hypothetical protein